MIKIRNYIKLVQVIFKIKVDVNFDNTKGNFEIAEFYA
jgi:hypothetical protein